MEGAERKNELISTTMQIVAEQGLHGFSMRQVTRRVGVSEALLYRYFTSKEELLFSCFESVHKSIAALFDHMQSVSLDSKEKTFEMIRRLWTVYFDFLVKSGYRTIFYFDYRDSSYMKYIIENDVEVRDTYFAGFSKLMIALDGHYDVFRRVHPDYLWTYVLDTTGVFAKRVIRGELPATEESYQIIYKLIFGGIYGLFGG